MERPPAPIRYEVLKIYDYGTKTLLVGILIRQIGEQPAPGKSTILRLQNQLNNAAPQIVGYARRRDGSLEFVWGYDLKKLRTPTKKTSKKKKATGKDQEIEDDRVFVMSFERLKIALLGSSKEAMAARRSIEGALKHLNVPENTVEDLFVRHLVALEPAISSAVIHEFSSLSGSRFTADQIYEMPVRVLFAVPEIASLGKVHNLTKLLKRAEFPETTLVPEAEASGAWHAFRYCEETLGPRVSAQTFTPGTEFLVCDGGGWTFGINLFTITGPTRDGTRMGMKATGKLTSLPLGSEMLNLKAIEYVKDGLRETYGGLEKALAQFGITENALNNMVSTRFESYKCSQDHSGFNSIEVRGLDTGLHFATHKQTLSIYYDLTEEQIEAWHNELLEPIIAGIESVKSPNCKIMTVTGGFSSSRYLMEALADHFKPAGMMVIAAGRDMYEHSDNAVVNGAPARFDVDAPKRPFPYAIGISQDEIYSKEFHPDMDEPGPRGTIPDPDDPEDAAKEWVENRWEEILPRGVLTVNSSEQHVKWLKYVIPEEAYAYEKTIFCTKDDLPEHAPTHPDGPNHPPRSELEAFDTINASFTLEDVVGMPFEYEPYLRTVPQPQPQVELEPEADQEPASDLESDYEPEGKRVRKKGDRKASRKPKMVKRSVKKTGKARIQMPPQTEVVQCRERALYLRFTTTLNGIDVSVKVERPKHGCDVYLEHYTDNKELVPEGDRSVAMSGGRPPTPGKRDRFWELHEPPQENMMFVASTSLLEAKYFAQLQVKDGAGEGASAGRAVERADSFLESFEEDDVVHPGRKRRHA